MADEGRLPGTGQKMRRIPRAFVERMVADAAAGAQVDMEDMQLPGSRSTPWRSRQESPAIHCDEHRRTGAGALRYGAATHRQAKVLYGRKKLHSSHYPAIVVLTTMAYYQT